jgi:hypothetical protein
MFVVWYYKRLYLWNLFSKQFIHRARRKNEWWTSTCLIINPNRSFPLMFMFILVFFHNYNISFCLSFYTFFILSFLSLFSFFSFFQSCFLFYLIFFRFCFICFLLSLFYIFLPSCLLASNICCFFLTLFLYLFEPSFVPFCLLHFVPFSSTYIPLFLFLSSYISCISFVYSSVIIFSIFFLNAMIFYNIWTNTTEVIIISFYYSCFIWN